MLRKQLLERLIKHIMSIELHLSLVMIIFVTISSLCISTASNISFTNLSLFKNMVVITYLNL